MTSCYLDGRITPLIGNVCLEQACRDKRMETLEFFCREVRAEAEVEGEDIQVTIEKEGKRAGITGNQQVVGRVRKSAKEERCKQKSLLSCRSQEKLVCQEGKVSSV